MDTNKICNYEAVNGKTAIVTGGAGGIGFELTTELAKNGARVIVFDQNSTRGRAQVDQLKSQGLEVLFIEFDPVSWESQSHAFKEALAWSGNQLDIVVPCAGLPVNDLTPYISTSAPNTDETPAADLQPKQPPISVIMTNLIGSYYSTTLALFYFNSIAAAQKGEVLDFKPQLVLISSIAGYEAFPFGADYTAAKFGVRGLWKSIRKPKPGMSQYQANLVAPLATRTGKGPEQGLVKMGLKLNEVGDVVIAIMGCICDSAIAGKAVACPQGRDGEPGTNNFDLCDDLPEHSGSKVMLQKVQEGVFGNIAAIM